MPQGDEHDPIDDRLTATWIELAIRLAVLGLLLYFAFILVRPFLTIAIWSVVLTVALYPAYVRMVGWLGGRRRLAAAVLTILGLLILLGPATWLALSLIEGMGSMSQRLDSGAFYGAVATRDREGMAADWRADLPVLATRFDQSPGRVGQDRSAVASSRRAACWTSRPTPGPEPSSSSSGSLSRAFCFCRRRRWSTR